MEVRDADVQLSAQRLRELMLWHGKDERNLPPADTLVHLSRDTVAAIAQLDETRNHLSDLRAALSQIFWSSESSETRQALLMALGAPPDSQSVAEELPIVTWQAVPNGLDWQYATLAPQMSTGGY